MEKAVLYARVSSEEQKKGYSIDAQVNLLKNYALKNNIQIVNNFISLESAKASGRPKFNSMLDFVKKERIPIVLVEKTDRLYRNIKDWVTIDELDVEIHLVKESEVVSDKSSSHQKFIHGIKVLMAKNYIDNLKEETKKGMIEKASQGGFPGLAPIGYMNIDKKIEIDEEKAHFVVKAYKLYSTGHYSLSTLRDRLHSEGFRSRNGTKLSEHGLQTILKNPFYFGYFF